MDILLKPLVRKRFEYLNEPLDASSQISARARFLDTQTVEIAEIHEHLWWFRDGSSVIGIILLISLWGTAGVRIGNSSEKAVHSDASPN